MAHLKKTSFNDACHAKLNFEVKTMWEQFDKTFFISYRRCVCGFIGFKIVGAN